MNQILETPTTLEQAQISVEHFHNQSIAQILDMNSKYISEADRGRIEDGVTSIKAIEHNPNSGRSGAFHTLNGKSNIEVSALSKEQMERTTKHETNHFASKNREIIVPLPDKGGHMVYQTVGMRHTSWFHNNTTGENSGFETRGRGLNEGMTTMYTNEQLSALSKEKGEAAEREQLRFANNFRKPWEKMLWVMRTMVAKLWLYRKKWMQWEEKALLNNFRVVWIKQSPKTMRKEFRE